MNNISFFLLAVLLLLLFFYSFLKKEANKFLVTETGTFGPKKKENLTKEQVDKIITSILNLKKQSFYAYLTSICICFMLGIFIIYKIVDQDINWKLLPQAIGIAGGLKLTSSFYKLYQDSSSDYKMLIKKL